MTGRTRPRAGTATVEFALVAPLVMLFLAGVLDFAMLLRTATCVANASRAGIECATRSGAPAAADFSPTLAAMKTAALNSSPNLAMTATAVRTCKCGDGSLVTCTGSCPKGSVLIYVQVKTQATAHTVFNYAALNFSNVTSNQASLRLQ